MVTRGRAVRSFFFDARAAQLTIGLVVFTATGCGTPAPDTLAIEPLRRLGESQFRLTRKDGMPRPFRFSPDGKLLAGANWDEVRIWSFPDGKLQHDFSSVVKSRCIAFSADGEVLVALQQPAMDIYRFEVSSGKLLGKVGSSRVDLQACKLEYSIVSPK